MIQFLGIPGLDLQEGVFRAWWFDPFVASVSFVTFVHWYWYHERKYGVSRLNYFNHFMKPSRGPILYSGVSYWLGIFLWKMVVPPAATKIPDGLPASFAHFIYLSCEVASGIVFYDGIFFFFHWAMHGVPLLQKWHRRHHERPQNTVESRDVLRHSFVDASLQVLINILVQRHTPWGLPKSRLARALHNIIVVWMLTESHTAAPTPYIWRRFFVGVREHRLHHLGSKGSFHRYQQFFGYLDNMRVAMLGKNTVGVRKHF